MKKTNYLFGILAGCAALMAAPAYAQTAETISLEGDVKVVKTIEEADGNKRTELVDPVSVVPGDRLIFRTNYKNTSDQVAENFVVTNPIPSAVALAPDADANLTVSVDGGESWGKLAALKIANEDATMRAAMPEDVTHIRWILASVAPGDEGQLTYKGIVR